MRILLVHASPLDSLGGAELSLREHLRATPEGIHVDVVHPEDSVKLKGYDTVILASLRPSGGQGQKAEYAWAKLWVKRLKGFNGYVVKSERDVHPCALRDGSCIQIEPLSRKPCECGPKISNAFEKLYNMCDAVQFLSPLHRQAINLLIDIKYPLQYEVASPVDFELFQKVKPFRSRKPVALITGDSIRVDSSAVPMAEAEGYDVEMIDYLSVPYEQMPEVLNNFQAIVVSPVMLHAFGRLVVEAMACGCRVLASPRVGAMSWPDPVEASREANEKFWEMVMNRPSTPHPLRQKHYCFW
jgi:glycosyltransferase involved in cell wall biosynthesis